MLHRLYADTTRRTRLVEGSARRADVAGGARNQAPRDRKGDDPRVKRQWPAGERFMGRPGCARASGSATWIGEGTPCARGLIDDDARVRSFILSAVVVAGLTLAAGASGRPVRHLKRSPHLVTLEWVGDM